MAQDIVGIRRGYRPNANVYNIHPVCQASTSSECIAMFDIHHWHKDGNAIVPSNSMHTLNVTAMLAGLIAVALSCHSALAHSENGMDMGMDGSMTLTMGSMLPYLHFTLGDNLWFLGWVPRSPEAMVGTCIGLFLLALIERWIAACRAMMEVHWAKRTKIALLNKLNTAGPSALQRLSPSSLINMRSAPPFIPAHDITRGVLHMGQAALGFAFMLAVMTFQIGFILAIVIGLGVGETLFGRFINHAAHLH